MNALNKPLRFLHIYFVVQDYDEDYNKPALVLVNASKLSLQNTKQMDFVMVK